MEEFQVWGRNLWSAAEHLTVTQRKKVSQKNTEAWTTLEGIPIGQIWDDLSIRRIQMVMEYNSWVLKETTSPLRETDKRVRVGGLCYLTLEHWLTNMNRMTKFKNSFVTPNITTDSGKDYQCILIHQIKSYWGTRYSVLPHHPMDYLLTVLIIKGLCVFMLEITGGLSELR